MYDDLIVVGAGPAGLAAGQYAGRAGVRVRLLEKGSSGGQMNDTFIVENYPGVGPIAGADLAALMAEQAVKFGAVITRAEVSSVRRDERGFSLRMDSGTEYKCRSLIVSLGASPTKLGIPGESEFTGRGVSYCAICDAPFYRDREVAVVGGGDSAVEESVYLARFVSAVHIIHRRDRLRAMREIQEKAFREPKIQIHWSHIPVAIMGKDGVDAIRIRSVKDGSEKDLPVYGVFFYVGLRPNSLEGLADLVKTDERGFIITDENMGCGIPGLFAAGDVRAKRLRQIATAVGDGALAANMAQQYLESL
jgi:thioredoxin reductase (NADPH)